MSTVPAFEAFVDAAIADPTLSKGDAADLITPFGANISGPEARAWLDAIAVGYETIGVLNNGTYSAMRNEIVAEGKTVSMALFAALAATINLLPETFPISEGIQILYLREERDQIDGNIVTMQGLKVGQNRQVREALQLGVDQLRGYKESVKDQLKGIGDV